MRWLRYVAIVALAIWVGGWLALGGVAAPITAGPMFGAIFHRFQLISWGLGGILLLSLGARAALGPRPRRLAVRIWTVVLMILLSVAAEFVAARRSEFPHWHELSTGLVGVTLLAGLGLLWAESHD